MSKVKYSEAERPTGRDKEGDWVSDLFFWLWSYTFSCLNHRSSVKWSFDVSRTSWKAAMRKKKINSVLFWVNKHVKHNLARQLVNTDFNSEMTHIHHDNSPSDSFSLDQSASSDEKALLTAGFNRDERKVIPKRKRWALTNWFLERPWKQMCRIWSDTKFGLKTGRNIGQNQNSDMHFNADGRLPNWRCIKLRFRHKTTKFKNSTLMYRDIIMPLLITLSINGLWGELFSSLRSIFTWHKMEHTCFTALKHVCSILCRSTCLWQTRSLNCARIRWAAVTLVSLLSVSGWTLRHSETRIHISYTNLFNTRSVDYLYYF